MEPIAHVPFVDRDSGDNAFVGVRAAEGTIELAVSIKTDGDISVAFGTEAAIAIRDALDQAIRHASGHPLPYLRADETRLIGREAFWGEDEITRRIETLTREVLKKVASSADGFIQLFRDPGDGRLWELSYATGRPDSIESAPRLHVVPPAEARERFGYDRHGGV